MKPKASVGDVASKMDADVLTAALTPNGHSQAGSSCYIEERIFSACYGGKGTRSEIFEEDENRCQKNKKIKRKIKPFMTLSWWHVY